MLTIQKATMKHWDDIGGIYERARSFMRETGNPNQWKFTHPLPEMLQEDIDKGNLYVVLDEKDVLGVFALLYGEDPTYAYIEGSWLNNDTYVTIHRIASAGKKSGILNAAIHYALGQSDNVRIDTHHDNKVMQHLLSKLGFSKCGIIYLENGEPRIAYQYEKKSALK